MNWPESLLALIFIGSWVFGIAVAGAYWVVAVFLPPAAWVFLAKWVLERWFT